VWHLQSPLLPLRAPAVLDRDLLQSLWRADCERRLEALAASRESARSEQAEISAALDRLRIQPPLTPAAATSGNTSGTPVRSPEAEAELAAFKRPRSDSCACSRCSRRSNAFVPAPSPEALELADAWDAHVAIPPGELPTLPPAAEPARAPGSRVEAKPAREATPAPPRPRRIRASPTRPARPAAPSSNGCNRATSEPRTRMFRRGLIPRKRAVEKYNQARLREQAALAGAGVDTYTEFLIAASARSAPRRSAARAR
jgi:hypothetical protein